MFSPRLYYEVKPYLPSRLRLAARRVVARRQRHGCHRRWPIDPAAGTAPAQWPGWPDGRQFGVVLTHDVEGPRGLARCRAVARCEQRLGLRSAFNFIPAGSYQTPAGLREELRGDGCEIGVHDLYHDGKLFNSRPEFLARAAGINATLEAWGAEGFRAGFMLRNLDWLHDLAIRYDSSTFDTDPFEPQPDGVGTVFPFWIPRPGGPAGSGYVELPYTLPQDFTLFVLLQERTPDLWKAKLDWIAACGGMVLIDTHPDYMACAGDAMGDATYPIELYRSFLEYLTQRYAGAFWPALPAEVAAFVRAHAPTGPALLSTAS